MNYQVRARLVLRRNCVGVVGPTRNATVGSQVGAKTPTGERIDSPVQLGAFDERRRTRSEMKRDRQLSTD